METWRLVGASLTALGGLLLVFFVMTKARDGRAATNADVARVGAIGIVVLATVVGLCLTVLPQVAVYSVAAFTVLAVLGMALVDG